MRNYDRNLFKKTQTNNTSIDVNDHSIQMYEKKIQRLEKFIERLNSDVIHHDIETKDSNSKLKYLIQRYENLISLREKLQEKRDCLDQLNTQINENAEKLSEMRLESNDTNNIGSKLLNTKPDRQQKVSKGFN